MRDRAADQLERIRLGGIYGEDVAPDRTIELLDQVSHDQVREVAGEVADQLSVAVVGPHTVEELESA